MGITHSDVLVNTDALCEIDIHTRKISKKTRRLYFQFSIKSRFTTNVKREKLKY